MANNYSAQAAEYSSDPDNWKPRKTQEWGGKVRRYYFDFDETTDAAGGSAALAEKIYLVKIPANCRVCTGFISHEAWESGTGTIKLDFGIEGFDGSGKYDAALATSDDVDFFSTAAGSQVNISAAGTATFNDNHDDAGFGYVTEKEVWLTATLNDGGAGAIAAGARLRGWIDVVQD